MSEQEGTVYINKEEAAELLGVQTRTISRYTSQGKLKKYIRGPRRQAVFQKDQVEQFKKELNRIVPVDETN